MIFKYQVIYNMAKIFQIGSRNEALRDGQTNKHNLCTEGITRQVYKYLKYKPHTKAIVWYDRVKSGNFGYHVNSNIHLQTVEIKMRRLLMSRLIRIYTVCLVNLSLCTNN